VRHGTLVPVAKPPQIKLLFTAQGYSIRTALLRRPYAETGLTFMPRQARVYNRAKWFFLACGNPSWATQEGIRP
jgi:hypothetical protein